VYAKLIKPEKHVKGQSRPNYLPRHLMCTAVNDAICRTGITCIEVYVHSSTGNVSFPLLCVREHYDYSRGEPWLHLTMPQDSICD